MMLQTIRKKKIRGFSLVEMITVMVIIGIIYSFAAPTFSRYNLRKKLQYEAQKIAEVLETAKSLATTKREEIKIEFDSSTGEFYYMNSSQTGKGNHYDRVYELDGAISFDTVPTEIIYLKNGSLASAADETIILGGSGSSTIELTINKRTGRVTVDEIS